MHSSFMRSDRGLLRSSLIAYFEAYDSPYMLQPISNEIEFNLISEDHHMRHYLHPGRGRKYVSLFYPNPNQVRIILMTVKGPSVLHLRGCDQLWVRGHFPFENLKSLTALEIFGVSHLTVLPKEISEMTQLQSLNLSRLPIQQFPADDSFSNLTNLRFLVLKACANLHSLPNLSNLTALVLLDLSHLLIEALPDGVFSNMKKLRKLILRSCSNLHSPLSIESLVRLEFLDISYTLLHLTTCPLAHDPTLTHVFGRCAKGSVYDSLVYQYRVKVLDLSGGHHLGGTFQLRKSMTCLQALDISRTNIESIDFQPGDFFYNDLQVLLLRNCSSLVQLSAMKDLKSLRVLNMSGCESLCVLPEDLCELVNLQELNLSGCTSLTKLREGVFDKMSCLQKLDLSKTNFKHLPSVAELISRRTRLILPRGLVLKVSELSSDIESKNLGNLVIVDDDAASPDLGSEEIGGNHGEIVESLEDSIPNEFHLVSTFTNTDSSFYRFKHEFTHVKNHILEIQSKNIAPKGSRTMLADLEYILENIDLLESVDHKGNASRLLDRLMDVVDPRKADNSNSPKDLC